MDCQTKGVVNLAVGFSPSEKRHYVEQVSLLGRGTPVVIYTLTLAPDKKRLFLMKHFADFTGIFTQPLVEGSK